VRAIEAAQSNDRKMVHRGKKIRSAEHGREETNMISRLWHGWTTRDKADAYEELLRSEILPGIHRVAGFKGALLLRRDGKDEVEFVTLTMFDSMEAVKEFAGDEYEVAVILPEARKLLTRLDARSAHYETVLRIE
jgi:heme-degrading monooxygenase HmoA